MRRNISSTVGKKQISMPPVACWERERERSIKQARAEL